MSNQIVDWVHSHFVGFVMRRLKCNILKTVLIVICKDRNIQNMIMNLIMHKSNYMYCGRC